MKTLTLEDGQWFQSVVTSGSRMSKVKSPADASDAAIAEAILQDKLPPAAQLISIYVIVPSNSGVINYRVGLEHKQVRF